MYGKSAFNSVEMGRQIKQNLLSTKRGLQRLIKCLNNKHSGCFLACLKFWSSASQFDSDFSHGCCQKICYKL